MAPLYALSGGKFDVKKDWGPEHSAAWEKRRVAVSEATCRYPADLNKQKVVCTDACQGGDGHEGGLAGFVAQIDPETGMLQPLGFFARPLANKRE